MGSAEVKASAGVIYHPTRVLYFLMDNAFTVNIGSKTKDERSAKLNELERAMMKQIVENELEPLLPAGFWWGVTQSACITTLGYLRTIKGFTVEVRVPRTQENDEWAMLMVMQGKASFDRP